MLCLKLLSLFRVCAFLEIATDVKSCYILQIHALFSMKKQA